MDLIKINGHEYALNLTKICEFISKMSKKDAVEKEILDSYDFEDGRNKQLSAKSVREFTNVTNGQENIVYDLVKIMIIQVVAYDNADDISLDYLPFGTKIAFNTLIEEGFLIEKK